MTEIYLFEKQGTMKAELGKYKQGEEEAGQTLSV